MTAPEMPEPGHLTALYWPESETATAAIAVRDDTAYGIVDDRHWRVLGLGKSAPLTWGELWALCHQVEAPIGEATVLTRPAEPTDAEVEAAARALFDTPPSEFHWDDLSDAAKPQWRRVARAALTAAARVRAGQAVTP